MAGETPQERYRRRHREQGLCMNCPSPAVRGRQRCEYHLAMYARYQLNRAKRRTEVEVYVSGHTACPVCSNQWARLILWPGSPPLLDCQACRSALPVRLQAALPPAVPGCDPEWADLAWVPDNARTPGS